VGSVTPTVPAEAVIDLNRFHPSAVLVSTHAVPFGAAVCAMSRPLPSAMLWQRRIDAPVLRGTPVAVAVRPSALIVTAVPAIAVTEFGATTTGFEQSRGPLMPGDDDLATVVDDGGDRHGGGGARVVGRHAGVVDTSVVVALAGRVTGVRIEADGAGIGRHRVGVHHPSIGVVLQRRKRVTAGEGHDEREHRNEPLATELSHDALLRATVISYMITVEF
jgi:hypothetical protein